jgi:uncharacterized FAD-dependent dehydrogenase
MQDTYVLRELAVPAGPGDPDLAQAVAAFLRIKRGRILSVKILRKSLDSRRRNRPVWRYAVEFACDGPIKHPRLTQVKSDASAGSPAVRHRPSGPRVAVIGSGPAGLAAALGLARKGYSVDVYEQGADVGRRFRDIRRFLKGNEFNPRSNILFGEGGAGTFSDGKLTCRTRNRFTDAFLRELAESGADPAVTYESHPHIGTDKLQFVIKGFRDRCVALGCRFHFDTVVDDIALAAGPSGRRADGRGRCAGVIVAGETIAFDAVVLAAGHSSRGFYAKLHAHGVAMDRKTFSVGVRVEHPQDMVNRRQLGDRVDTDLTGAAEYFLTFNGPAPAPAGAPALAGGPALAGAPPAEKLSAYSFCMCPGGVVVPCADAADGLFTNGMSYSNRAGAFANSAVVVPVTPEELPGAGDPAALLAGVDFIRDMEVKAFKLGGGDFVFPAQTIRAFLENRVDEGPLPKTSFPKPIVWANLRSLFPPKINEALAASFGDFDRKLPGFIDQGLCIGPESRTSSPLRILRDAETLESINTPGLFPLGEGAGYSGGIVSSGADGFKLAEAWEDWAAGSTAGRGGAASPKSS